MLKLKKLKKSGTGLALLAAISATQAASASSSGMNVQTLTPAFGLNYMMTETAIPEYGLDGKTEAYRRYFLNVSYNTLNDPLVQLDPTHTMRQATIIDRIQTLDMQAGIELNGRVALGFALPLNLIQRPLQAAAFSPGDTRIFGKIFLNRDRKKVNFALIPEMTLPSGSADLFVSDGTMGAGLLLAAEYDFGNVKVAANTGYRYSGGASYQAMNFKSRIPMALGVTVPVGPRWHINGEIAGTVPLPISRYQNPSELYGGVRYAMNRNFVFHSGLSIGDVTGTGSGDLRFSMGLKFSPFVEQRRPIEAPIRVAQAAPVPAPRVVFTKKEIKITEEVKFEHNKDVLTASGKNLLDEVATVIKANLKSFKKIRIDGHTNEIGSHKYNMNLSQRRATAVKEYLASRGIDKKVLATLGFGKTVPKKVGKKLSKQARLDANRRVEFKVQN